MQKITEYTQLIAAAKARMNVKTPRKKLPSNSNYRLRWVQRQYLQGIGDIPITF